MMHKQLSYDEFWSTLSAFYPVSKGEMKLPIATKIIDLNTFITPEHIGELKNYLQTKIDTATPEHISKLMEAKGDINLSKIPMKELYGVVRFDCMIDEKNGVLKIIEINSDYPDGFLLHDKTFSTLLGSEITTHESYFKKNTDGHDYVYILYPENAVFLDAYHTEFEQLKKIGVDAGIGTVNDISFKEGYFWHNDKKITMIRRCCEVYKLPTSFFVETKTKILNSIHMRAFGYKDNLVEKESFILQSEKLDQSNMEKVIANKDMWVLKPTNLSEGKGIVLGVDSSKDEWKHEVMKAIESGNYIVQEYLSPKKITLEYYDDGRVKEDSFYFDICPHFLIENGKVTDTGHILMRFSKEKILNVTKGGAIGYGAFL